MQISRIFGHFFLAIILSTSSYSQNLKGRIVDEENFGIGYAHVFFQNDQSRGSISNEIGEFILSVTGTNNTDTLIISRLGYESMFIPYLKIHSFDNVFKLNSSALRLDEVTIISDSYYRYILKEAIAKIPDNYPVERHLQKGYYQNYTISDSTYSEMIEADFQLVSNGYADSKLKEEIYLHQLRKTEDQRNLPARLKSKNNSIFTTLRHNSLRRRSLSRFGFRKDLMDISDFITSVDDIHTLQLHSQSIQDGDTILTIKISDPFFSSMIYSLVSINLTDKAIVKMVFGDPWSEKQDFDEIAFRKMNGRYYPAYIRSIIQYEFDNKTRKHYTSHCILFYSLISDKQSIKSFKKGKRIKREKEIRKLKMKVDDNFWKEYTYNNQVSATAILRAKFD